MDTKLFKVVLKALWAASGDAVVVVGSDGSVVGANEHIHTLLGWDPDEIVGETVESLIPIEKRGVHRIHRRYFSSNPSSRRMGNDTVLCALTKDGRSVPVDISLSAVEFEGESYTVTVIRDAQLRQEHEREWKEKSFRDPLTGVYNRYYFDEQIDRIERGGIWPVTILIANINDLPAINEAYGHLEGDNVIRRGASVLIDAVRETDIVARLSGDKFVVLLEDCDQEEIELLIATIHRACQQDDGLGSLRMSIGSATAPTHQSLRAIIRTADARMYEVRGRELV